MTVPSDLAGEQYCYLTTRGRVTGRPHRIEIWFALDGSTLYLLSGGRDRSDWVKNLQATPEVTVEVGPRTFSARARVVEEPDEDERADYQAQLKEAQDALSDNKIRRRLFGRPRGLAPHGAARCRGPA